MRVTIPHVRTFPDAEPSKEQALKPLEEAAEVFAAWQRWDLWTGIDLRESMMREAIVDECCDVIMATCNLLASLGVTDLTEAMAKCERRNRERGRYDE